MIQIILISYHPETFLRLTLYATLFSCSALDISKTDLITIQYSLMVVAGKMSQDPDTEIVQLS